MDGDRNAALMARRSAAIPRGLAQAQPVFVARAENALLWDVDGRRYVDFAGGIAVLNVGHRNPRVLEAVRAQLDQVTHTCFQVLGYEPYLELCERLNRLAPGAWPKKTLLMSTGAEAVENAIKIARAHTKRPGVIAFGGGFHGRTLMALALTGKVDPYKTAFGPLPGEVFHAPFPSALHGVSTDAALAAVEKVLKFEIEPSRVAAVIVEPVQGEGGFYVAPRDFMTGLRALCDQHSIVLIADEIQTGAGRTGRLFAMEHYDVAGDLTTTAKSIGGGFPVAAVTGRAEIMDACVPGSLGTTFGGNPVACAAALAVLDLLEKEPLLERATALGARLTARLERLAGRHAAIAEVRGLGAMVAFELCHKGDPRRPAADLAKALTARARELGLILLSCGLYGNVIRILVPLTAVDAVVDEGLDIIERAVDELCPAAGEARAG